MKDPLLHELQGLLPEGGVLGPEDLAGRARNAWDASPLEARALVRPSSTAELSRVMRLCHAHGQTVVVHGGLTGVCDGDRATRHDVVVSFERMTSVEEIDVVGRTATVQAGCTLQAAQAAVERQGLFFPLDLGARGSCTIGGNVATNAGGSNVLRYGMMRAQVLGLEAVLADGTIISSMNRMIKNNTGYDVKQLFIGTEGTLGIVTRAVVALRESSSSINTVLVALDDGEKIARFLKHMDRALGGTLSSFEAMWGDYYREVTAPGRHVSPFGRDHSYYVIAEAQGPHQDEDTKRFEAAVEQAFEAGLVVDAVLPKSGTERDRVWAIRENFEAIYEHRPIFLYDIGVPIRDMLAYVAEVRASVARRWPSGHCWVLGHIGDGNLHFFVTPGSHSDEPAQLHRISDELVYEPLSRYGGAVSAEHGTGLEKKPWMRVTRSAAEIELMRLLKRTLDPRNILNRGKVLDVG
jgi:FAD/FMN-containing dehydrogenase